MQQAARGKVLLKTLVLEREIANACKSRAGITIGTENPILEKLVSQLVRIELKVQLSGSLTQDIDVEVLGKGDLPCIARLKPQLGQQALLPTNLPILTAQRRSHHELMEERAQELRSVLRDLTRLTQLLGQHLEHEWGLRELQNLRSRTLHAPCKLLTNTCAQVLAPARLGQRLETEDWKIWKLAIPGAG